jgi:hypothetical protein
MPIVNVMKEKELKNAYIGEPTWEPWIYYNSTLGLISLSSDGSNWITIADKNQGASNVWDYGYHFQWGNNYWFPNSWSVSTSTTRVNTSSYWPNNYYSDSTFRRMASAGDVDRSNPSNNNLWGDTTNTLVARKWPCDTGYHIPTASERLNIISIWNWWGFTTWALFADYLKMPYNWLRDSDGGSQLQWSWGFYSSSSPYSSDASKQLFLQYSSSIIEVQTLTWSGAVTKAYGFGIRPFKNEAIVPDDTWTALYQPGTVLCDFTTSDCWFVFDARTTTSVSYGRDSNWLYALSNASNLMAAVWWRVPSSISTRWNLKKFEMVLCRTGGNNLWGWLVTGADTKVIRYWDGGLATNFSGTSTSVITTGTSANTDYTITIDIENKELYMSNSSTKLTLSDGEITAFNTSWNNGEINLCWMIYASSWTYTYVKNATFYF